MPSTSFETEFFKYQFQYMWGFITTYSDQVSFITFLLKVKFKYIDHIVDFF